MVKNVEHTKARKHHLREIILLFSVPIGIIVVLIAFLYVPRLFANPTYDFIYCEGYSCDNSFSVNPSGTLVVPDEPNRRLYDGGSRLYYYDTKRDATRPLHIDEASRYQLDTTSKSPDGYTLRRSSGSSGFLFWSDYQNSWSLSKGLIAKPITLDSRGNSNTFIGWVLQ